MGEHRHASWRQLQEALAGFDENEVNASTGEHPSIAPLVGVCQDCQVLARRVLADLRDLRAEHDKKREDWKERLVKKQPPQDAIPMLSVGEVSDTFVAYLEAEMEAHAQRRTSNIVSISEKARQLKGKKAQQLEKLGSKQSTTRTGAPSPDQSTDRKTS